MAVEAGARALAAAAVTHAPMERSSIHEPSVLQHFLTKGTFGKFQQFNLQAETLALLSINQQLCIDNVRRRWQNLQFRCGRDPRLSGFQRKRVVVLGTGWASMNFIMRLDVTKYDVVIVSPRNFFTFTPLLPSVCAGTLSPRSCLEPVRNKMLRGGKKVMKMYEAWGTAIDSEKKTVKCKALTGEEFEVPYDYLVVGVGSETNTFGIPGVEEYAHFLKDVSNAREIHKKVVDCFERASLPTTSEEEKKRLLRFVMVGGGPSGVETAAEIADFVREDASRHFPDLVKYVTISLVEMLPRILPVFNQSVSDFTLENLRRLGIDMRMKCRVTRITKESVHIVDEKKETHEIPYGFVLWASGVGQVPFAKHILSSVEVQKPNRVVKVNEKLQVIGLPFVYAMGDCTWLTPRQLAADVNKLYAMAKASGDVSTTWLIKMASNLARDYPQLVSTGFDLKQLQPKHNLTKVEFAELLKKIDLAYRPPPPTAQTANQEAQYLATIFNHYHSDKSKAPAYMYKWKGQLAYVGDGQSVIQTPNMGTWLGGRSSNAFWKMFYWSNQMSITNRLICIFDWCRAVTRGRDVGRDQCKDILPPAPVA